MASLRSLINGLLGSTNSVQSTNSTTNSNSGIDPAIEKIMRENAAAVEKLTKTLSNNDKRTKELDEKIQHEQNKLNELTRAGQSNSAEAAIARANKKKHERERQNLNRDTDAEAERFREQFNLTLKQFNEFADQHEDFNAQFQRSNAKTSDGFNTTSKLLNKNFSNISGDITKFFEEFGIWGALIAAATNRMIEMNTKLVEHNRRMGGTFSNDQLGMDLYGNSTAGNIDTITTGNNINMQDFLASQQIFKSSKIGFTDTLKDQAAELRNYGLEVGKLSKFYGVEVSTINQISGNLMYGYGVKIKDLGSILQEGKEKAVEAGVSVQDYFAKLKDATESLGEYYIAGGIKGMENLALYAAKTDMSVKSILGYTEKFKDFTSQFSQQNKASQLGLQSASIMMSKVWALSQIGRQQDANKLMSTSLVSDLRNNGGFDGTNGDLTQKGIMSLQALGIDKEQIGQIQKLNKVWRETGVTAEQQLNLDKQSLDIKTRVAQYEKQNATVGERLNSLWTKLKGLILDPLMNLFAPVLNTALDVLIGVVDVLTFVLKPVTYGFGKIGEVLTWVGKQISNAVTWVTTSLDSLGITFEKGTGVFNGLLKTVGTVIAGFLTIGIGMKAGSMLKGIGSKLSGGVGFVERMIGKPGATQGLWQSAKGMASGGLRNGAGMLKGLGGAAKSGIGGLIGYGVGQMVGGKGGNTISNIASDAAMGAMIGSIIPGLGTAVGGAIGGIVGLVRSSWDEIDGIWKDGSKSMWEKTTASADVLWTNLKGAVISLGDWLDNITPEWLKELQYGGLYSEMKKSVRDGTIEGMKKDDKYSGNIVVQSQFSDQVAQISSIMNQRVIKTAYESSKTQEKLIEKQTPTKVVVNVNPSMYGNAPKQRINQF